MPGEVSVPPSLSSYTIEETVNEIMSYLKKAGTESYLGPQEESVTQLSHSLQAAEQAKAFVDGLPPSSPLRSPSFPLTSSDIVLAALLHDIGHMILSRPDSWDPSADVSEQHEWVGYHYLLNHHFSAPVAQLVLGHVQAKRYLTYREAGYYDKLSDSSRMTLVGQGGPMTEAEAVEFEKGELFDVKLHMRVWDEEAKILDWQEKGDELDRYRTLITQHLQRQQTQRTA
jgi:predicted HD phosphohydrolase